MMKDKIDIIIPTLKSLKEIKPQIEEMEQNTQMAHRIIATCQKASASGNRNIGLELSNSPFIIMVDDDMTGFFPGWEKKLIKPLLEDPLICMTSARLINKDKTVPKTCANNVDVSKSIIYVRIRKDSVMPSACIAFRNIGLRFDERYIGSGWEDTDFCFQYLAKNKAYEFVIVNECRLIHLNEMKAQYTRTPNGTHFEINKQAFYKKWSVERTPRNK